MTMNKRRSLVPLFLSLLGAAILGLLGYDHWEKQSAALCQSRAENRLTRYEDLPALARELRSDRECVVAEAMKDIGRFGRAALDFVPDIIAHMDHSSPFVRWRAVTALGNIGTFEPEMKEPIRRLLKENNSTVRVNATYGWALLGVKGLESEALSLLSDGDPQTRINVLSSIELALPSRPSQEHALKKALHDPSTNVRFAASDKVAKLRFPALIDDLVRLLDDPSPEVRSSAAWALRATSANRAVPELQLRLTRETDKKVSRRYRWALSGLDERVEGSREEVANLVKNSSTKELPKVLNALFGREGGLAPFIDAVLSRLKGLNQHEIDEVTQIVARSADESDSVRESIYSSFLSASEFSFVRSLLGVFRYQKNSPREELRKRLHELLDSEDGEVRASSAQVLSRMEPRSDTLDKLKNALECANACVPVAREEAAAAIGAFGKKAESLVEPLLAAGKQDRFLAIPVLYAFSQIGNRDPNVLTYVSEQMQSSKLRVRAYARFAREQLFSNERAQLNSAKVIDECWEKGSVVEGVLSKKLREIVRAQSSRDESFLSHHVKTEVTHSFDDAEETIERVEYLALPFERTGGTVIREYFVEGRGYVITQSGPHRGSRISEYSRREVDHSAYKFVKEDDDWKLQSIREWSNTLYDSIEESNFHFDLVSAIQREVVCSLE